MNHLDTLYRALIDYRKNTLDNRECKTQRAAIITANSEEDVIKITRKNCIVEDDWIEAIEKGLVFIEKAIKEERQFIRSNGEVVPIEKVKRTSKDSVEHLAKHSNLFTREPAEGEDLIPDQLYTVERLSDFAVYENRFLYMLLCYLRDFIGIRYEKILELTNTYKGSMSMNKAIVESNRKVTFELKLEEERKNDEYLREHNAAQTALDRILTIYKAVTLYLATPLMNEVGKAPMLKPPIIRTNVLKMNRNFSQALRLYEFVTSYDKDGYEIQTVDKTVSPFVGVVADEIAEVVDLSLFLAYEHGLNIREHFKRNYEREEERRKKEEQRRFAEQLKNVGRHLKENGISAEEYILMLERRIRDLEESEEELVRAKKRIEELEKQIEELKTELQSAQDTVQALGEEVVRLNQKYIDDMAAKDAAHAEEIRVLNENHENAMQALQDEYEQKIYELQQAHEEYVARLNQEHDDYVEGLNREHAEYVENLKQEHEELVASLREEIRQITDARKQEQEKYDKEMRVARETFERDLRRLNDEHLARAGELHEQIAQGQQEIKALNEKYRKLEEQKIFADGRLTALRCKYGLMDPADDFSTKEKTDELEEQFKIFRKFYKAEWRKTKRKIWREIFGKREEPVVQQPTVVKSQIEASQEVAPEPNQAENINEDEEK